MSPADERRRLVQAAQRREPHRSDEWLGQEPGLRSSLDAAPPSAVRGWLFAAVSAGLVVAALGLCWVLASSDSVARWLDHAPDRAGTTEVTAAPVATGKTVDVAPLPNPTPTTVQPPVVPTAAPLPQPAAAPAPVETTAEVAPAAATVAPTTAPALPAAAPRTHHEPAGRSTLRVVTTPQPEPEPAPAETRETPPDTTPTAE